MLVDKKLIEKAKDKLGDENAIIMAELLDLEDFDNKNYKSRCPYHSEQTASFIYNPKAHMVLIDPPYIISKDSGYVNNAPDKTDYIAKYGKHSIDFGEWDKQELDLQFVLSELYRVLKDNGTLLCFYDIWKFQEFKETAEKIGFKQPRIGTWNKTNPVPINSKLNYLSNAKEYFCTFVKKSKPTFNSEYDNGDYFIENSDTYQLPILHGKERLKHPTQKPLALIKFLVEKHTNKFGRFIPGHKKHYDDVLGIELASNNQYAEVIS